MHLGIFPREILKTFIAQENKKGFFMELLVVRVLNKDISTVL